MNISLKNFFRYLVIMNKHKNWSFPLRVSVSWEILNRILFGILIIHFSCSEICSFLQIVLHLLNKSLTQNFFFFSCPVLDVVHTLLELAWTMYSHSFLKKLVFVIDILLRTRQIINISKTSFVNKLNVRIQIIEDKPEKNYIRIWTSSYIHCTTNVILH